MVGGFPDSESKPNIQSNRMNPALREKIETALENAESEARNDPSSPLTSITLRTVLERDAIACSYPDDGKNLDSSKVDDLLNRHLANLLGTEIGGGFYTMDSRNSNNALYAVILPEESMLAKPESLAAATATTSEISYGGLGRFPYLGIMFALGLGEILVILGMVKARETDAVPAVLIICGVVALILVFQRLKNIGMNPWQSLLMLVPIVSLFIGIRAAVYQEGFVEEGEIDKTGKIILAVVLVSLLCCGLFVGIPLWSM